MRSGTAPISGCRPSFSSPRGSSRRSKPAAARSRTRSRRRSISPISTTCRNSSTSGTVTSATIPARSRWWRPRGALVESILEINIFGLRDSAKIKKQIVDHKASRPMRLGPAAVRAGDLLCLSGLYAADADGAIPQVRDTAGLKYFGAPAHHEMRAILTAAGEICGAAGASISNLLRVNHFVSDLNVVYPALRAWQETLAGAPIPFGAVRTPTPMPVPGCNVVADMWVYHP